MSFELVATPEKQNKICSFFPRVSIIQLSLFAEGNLPFLFLASSNFFPLLPTEEEEEEEGDTGKQQLFAVIGSLITLRWRPPKQHHHGCYLSSLDKGQKVLPNIIFIDVWWIFANYINLKKWKRQWVISQWVSEWTQKPQKEWENVIVSVLWVWDEWTHLPITPKWMVQLRKVKSSRNCL